MLFLYIYLGGVNLAAFVMMGIDKLCARWQWRRIPERTLLAAAILGGSVGGLLGMGLFRHKTLHLKFLIGLPLMLVFHLLLALALSQWF